MSKILFTDIQIQKLRKNKWIKNITSKRITYTDDFKIKLVKECEDYKKFPRNVFEECGIHTEIVGDTRIYSCAKRWRKQYKNTGEVKDTRKGSSGRPLKRELSDKEKLERAEARIKLLEAENELLKKKRIDRNGTFNRYKINIKFEVIKYVINKYQLKGMTTYLCNCIGVSKSGYYTYLSNENKRIEKEKKDKEDFEWILKAYKFKKRKKGSRQIKMVLDNEFNIHFNLKKIRRLMKKYGLKCPIRQANPYRRMMKATQEHTTCDNLVNRIFKTGIPYNILLIDITYLFYGNNKKCYLSTIKDAETNEILAYYISENMTLDISLETIKKLHRKRKLMLSEKVIIHSDQGVHYTSSKFHNLLKKYNIQQSMSRKGNSMDNGMMENFFGLLKTEMFYDQEDKYKNIDELILAIDDYINYYNYDRIKLKLKGLSPVNYRLQSSN